MAHGSDGPLPSQVPFMLRRLRELQSVEADGSPGIRRADLQGERSGATSQDCGGSEDAAGPLGSAAERDREGEERGEESQPVPAESDEPSLQLGFTRKAGSRAHPSVKPASEPLYQAVPETGEPDRRREVGSQAQKRVEGENSRAARQKLRLAPPDLERAACELSNSSWSEMSPWVIGTKYRLEPLTPAMEQRLILQYLTPLGEYQEVGYVSSLITPPPFTVFPPLTPPLVFPTAFGRFHADGSLRTAHALHRSQADQ